VMRAVLYVVLAVVLIWFVLILLAVPVNGG
jgi:hypothetical protein